MVIRREFFRRWLLAAGLLAAASLALVAQQPSPISVATAPLSALVPTDPATTVGTLPNGLRYYVRANKKPERRAELRLVVRAGSVLEDDDQQGLAHLVEHMAFEGTTHFPRQSILSFLSSFGMGLGPDANAATSYDETVFKLQVPADRLDILDRSLLILEDWAHNLTFDPSAIERERGVVMEEWRLGLGANERTRDKEFPVLLKDSRYADRQPIGKPDIIQHAPASRLIQFYKDWYRPDLMAVVAVGDFDPATVEDMIKAHFASIAGPVPERPRPAYDVPDHPGTAYAIATDKEATSTSIEIENLLPLEEPSTIGGYRQKIVDRLFTDMLGERFAELAQRPDAPFIAATADHEFFLTRTRQVATLGALVKNDGIERGLDALLGEAERVTRFGFTATELERDRTDNLRAYERARTESDSRDSASRAEEFIRNFLEKETLPTIDDEYAMQARFLPQITLDEVNRLAREWFGDRDRFVLVSAPDRAGVAVPTEGQLAAVMKSALTKDLKPYVDTAGNRPLFDATPKAGTIASTVTKDAVGVTQWTLSNGVTVVLKPTTFKEDEVLFRASSPGGTSLASDQDYVPASFAAQLVAAGGLGTFNAIDLGKVLTGKVAEATPSITELDEGLSGGSSTKDLETLFQLIYLRFTKPRSDPAMVNVIAGQVKSILANEAASPEFAFEQTLENVMGQGNLRRRPQTVDTIAQWNLDKSVAFYKDRFADASGFTFVFVGNFTLDAMKPLVERYLAALPATHRHETWKDVGVRPPTGVIEKTVEQGVEPKSQVGLVFTGPFPYDDAHRVALRALTLVLQSRLVATIREQLGGTYSIVASQNAQRIPDPEYAITIQWTCDPARTEDLVQRVFQEIAFVKNTPLAPGQVGVVQEALLRDFDTNSQQNSYLLSQILQAYQRGDDVASVWKLPDVYRSIDSEMIQHAAETYLNTNNYVRVTLMPEKK